MWKRKIGDNDDWIDAAAECWGFFSAFVGLVSAAFGAGDDVFGGGGGRRWFEEWKIVEFTNRPKCEHTLEQSYSGMYSIFQQRLVRRDDENGKR